MEMTALAGTIGRHLASASGAAQLNSALYLPSMRLGSAAQHAPLNMLVQGHQRRWQTQCMRAYCQGMLAMPPRSPQLASLSP
jgi:hypothetical protein